MYALPVFCWESLIKPLPGTVFLVLSTGLQPGYALPLDSSHV